jgi:hypothetical protein
MTARCALDWMMYWDWYENTPNHCVLRTAVEPEFQD